MKRNIRLLLLFISFFCLLIIYIILDRELYFYGHGNFEPYKNTLPEKLEPDYYGSRVTYPIQGFVINDEFRFLIIGKNKLHKYDTISFLTEEIIKYGYNEDFLLAFVKSTSGNFYYVKVFNESNWDGDIRYGYDIYRSDKEITLDSFTWVDVKQDEAKVSKLIRIRIRVLIVLILLIPLWLTVTWIFKKKAELDANERF